MGPLIDHLANDPFHISRSGQTIVIQLLLVAAVLGIALWMFTRRTARVVAVRRLFVVAFALVGVMAILMPQMLTAIANVVGVGRGADLLLYVTVVVLLGFMVLQESRTRHSEKQVTMLSRRLAISEAESPASARARLLGPAPGDDGPAHPGEGGR